ncbi:fatty acid desaturase [Paraburkholderia sp. UCT2]|uniref:fatty acid desaturase n=1 Tax=Paraburkholderia sp. UCT2 TaxID=2615208 RepID=UPI0016555519|nr:fatty acid desaturase [Paraburkholderia sp. UCT2]MBC8727703.1 fatty acid desaturase [Paraburkholderia sp. UCT2]
MFESGARESMRVLPRILQPVLTWITGKPLEVNEARLILPNALDVLITFASTVAIVSSLVWLAGKETIVALPLILVSWLVLVGLLRKMQVTHLHHAIHNRLFASPRLNKLYACVLPSLIFVQNGFEYRKEHLEHHNADIFTTERDSDAAFLAKLGFIPGRERGELWMNLWMTVASPVFHIVFARARLESVFLRNKPGETLLALGVAIGHIAFIVIAGWKVYVIAVFFPMFVLYHISALLQFLTEHAWNVAGGAVDNWNEYKSRCWGRFCGEPFPSRQAKSGSDSVFTRVFRVCLWATKMFVLHLPVRAACMVADLPAHDWHHLAHMAGQNSRDWTRSLYLRQLAISDGDKPGFAQRELWGMYSMIEHQFLWLQSIRCTYSVANANECAHTEESVLSSGE